jgi:hypothetical protein
MTQSAENDVAAIEQRRINALMAADINTLHEIMDEQCTHIESNGTPRTKAAFLEDVAKREFSFDLFEVVFSIWRWPFLYHPPEGISIDK